MFGKVKAIGDWIYTKPQGSEYWMLPLLIIAWDQLYNIIITSILFTYTNLFSHIADNTELLEDPIYVNSWNYPFELIVSASLEELVFRIIPLVLLLRYTKSRLIMVLVVITSSFFFSFIHGGPVQLLLQGIGGMVYCFIFIKYSENGTKLLQASAVVILMHIIFNAIATLISVAGGGNTF